MNSLRAASNQGKASTAGWQTRQAFTLIEILIVISIIILLVTLMGAVIGNSVKKAKEAATATLIEKIDKLLDERTKGFDRATKSLDFQRIIAVRKQLLEAGGIFGVSPKVLSAVARKDFFRTNFPQRYSDLIDVQTFPMGSTPNGVPDAIEFDPMLKPEDANGNGVLDGTEDTNSNGVLDGYVHAKHKPETESSALLYYMLTRMQVFGVPPVGETDFSTSEYRDTDGDGLLEFVDGWGQPLRFYRWPTRLLKPNGIRGADNQPGVAGTNDNPELNNTVDDFLEFGKVSSDDITVSPSQRGFAGHLILGLPSGPVFSGQWDSLSEDPDDPYGLISTEIKRLYLQSNGVTNVTAGASGFNEMNFPTIDTYHTPLIISAGPNGQFGLYLPNLSEDLNGDGMFQAAEDTNGNGVLDNGVLAQPMHGSGNAFDFASSTALSEDGSTDVISALTDNITNRNRRAGQGK